MHTMNLEVKTNCKLSIMSGTAEVPRKLSLLFLSENIANSVMRKAYTKIYEVWNYFRGMKKLRLFPLIPLINTIYLEWVEQQCFVAVFIVLYSMTKSSFQASSSCCAADHVLRSEARRGEAR